MSNKLPFVMIAVGCCSVSLVGAGLGGFYYTEEMKKLQPTAEEIEEARKKAILDLAAKYAVECEKDDIGACVNPFDLEGCMDPDAINYDEYNTSNCCCKYNYAENDLPNKSFGSCSQGDLNQMCKSLVSMGSYTAEKDIVDYNFLYLDPTKRTGDSVEANAQTRVFPRCVKKWRVANMSDDSFSEYKDINSHKLIESCLDKTEGYGSCSQGDLDNFCTDMDFDFVKNDALSNQTAVNDIESNDPIKYRTFMTTSGDSSAIYTLDKDDNFDIKNYKILKIDNEKKESDDMGSLRVPGLGDKFTRCIKPADKDRMTDYYFVDHITESSKLGKKIIDTCI